MKIQEKIKEYAKRVKEAQELPHVLASLNVEMAAMYSYHTAQYIEKRLQYAEFYKKHKVKVDKKLPSDPFINNLYLTTKEGQEYYELKRGLRAFEQMISATRGSVYTANTDRKLTPQ